MENMIIATHTIFLGSLNKNPDAFIAKAPKMNKNTCDIRAIAKIDLIKSPLSTKI